MIDLAAAHNLFHVPAAANFRDAAVAIIVLDDGRYLMQLRDDKKGIFYPDSWGLFGGAVDPGETAEEALRRELREELDFTANSLKYLTRMDFDFACVGGKSCYRVFYEIQIRASEVAGFRLNEGRLMEPLPLDDILLNRRVVPYDAFALWLHYAERMKRRASLG
jgi:8-oxo-dGTP pyrophosphatase MutT (NUDIX family)